MSVLKVLLEVICIDGSMSLFCHLPSRQVDDHHYQLGVLKYERVGVRMRIRKRKRRKTTTLMMTTSKEFQTFFEMCRRMHAVYLHV